MKRKRKASRDRAYKARQKWMNTTPEGAAYRMYWNARNRALKSGHDFTITLADIIIPLICPLLGIAIVIGGGNKNKDTSPSLDRIDSTKGYTPDNVWVISARANRIKNDATLSEFETIAANWRQCSERRECL